MTNFYDMPYMYIPRIMHKFRATSYADYGLVIIDFSHTIQGYFNGIGEIMRLPQYGITI